MITILVIEDDPLIRTNMLETLELEDYTAHAAENGMVGVAMARELLPDLIICDITMPRMSGYEVLLALRSEPETALIPFIFLTARTRWDEIRFGMEMGADDYLTKPFTTDGLLAAVAARLERTAIIAQERDNRLNALREDILYMLPHELRTPLTGVLGYSEILAEDGAQMSGERVVEIAEAIRRAGNRLHHLIESFLVYVQAELIQHDPERLALLQRQQTHDPAMLITVIARDAASVANRSSDLTLSLMDVGVLQVANDNLEWIIGEVLSNAFKFSAPGTPVRCTSRIDGEYYLIEISDKGRGMTPEQVRSIGAYVQFERGLYEQQGAGLGLIIARGLAELHNGKLTIESAQGQGTTVQIRLHMAT